MFPSNGGFGGFGGAPPGGFGGAPPGGFGGPPGGGGFNWSGMSGAPADESGSYFPIGSFVVEVERCVLKISQKGDVLFIVECLVKHSTTPEAAPGGRFSWIQKMHRGQFALTAFSAVKAFVVAALGLDTQQDAELINSISDPMWDGFMRRVYGQENTLGGCTVNLTTASIQTKDGKPFTKHNWRAFDYEGAGMQAPDARALFAGGSAPVPAYPQAAPVPAYPQAAPPPPAPPAPPRVSDCGNWRLENNQWVPNR